MTTMTSLGDIMGPPPTTNNNNNNNKHSNAPGAETTTLASKYGITHPLDRMALTANGNLQRLVASYYDAPVTVVVESCTLRAREQPQQSQQSQQQSNNSPPQIWDRVVHLQVFGQTFCTATSVIAVHDALCQQLVQSGAVGLGQLFRYLDLLPEFELHAAGPTGNGNCNGNDNGGFWREYTLRCSELTCHIVEDFGPRVWEMRPKQE